MQVFKTKVFSRFAWKGAIDDTALCDAVDRLRRGLVDADLGGGVIKQRIARSGAGRSGGFRVIILFRVAERAVFVYGFSKNERENIMEDELIAFRRLAALMLSYGDEQIATAIDAGELIEVICG